MIIPIKSKEEIEGFRDAGQITSMIFNSIIISAIIHYNLNLFNF